MQINAITEPVAQDQNINIEKSKNTSKININK